MAQQELEQLTNPFAFSIFTEELVNLHRGQGMELHWRDSLYCPSEEEYIKMIGNKTGGLFRLAVRLMQGESSSKSDYAPLVETLGILFQVRDDYQNLQSDIYSKNKGYCEDISEGKFSYPIIHSIRSQPGDHRLLSILKQHSEDVMVKQYAVEYIRSTGSFAYCQQKIAFLLQQAREELVALDGKQNGGQMRAILELLEISPPTVTAETE